MIDIAHLSELNLVLVRAKEPFSFLDLSAHAVSVQGALPNDDLARPMLFDFRGVSLIRQDTSSIHRMFVQRQKLAPQAPNNPAAYIVANEDDYGMMRMYCSLAAVHGLREIDRNYVTQHAVEAVRWLLTQAGQPRQAEDTVLSVLQDRLAS